MAQKGNTSSLQEGLGTTNQLEALFRYCFPCCPSCPAYAIQMGQATWSSWAAIQKYNLTLPVSMEVRCRCDCIIFTLYPHGHFLAARRLEDFLHLFHCPVHLTGWAHVYFGDYHEDGHTQGKSKAKVLLCGSNCQNENAMYQYWIFAYLLCIRVSELHFSELIHRAIS